MFREVFYGFSDLTYQKQLPSIDPQDDDFRRLKYLRYADDFVLAFSSIYPTVLYPPLQSENGVFTLEGISPPFIFLFSLLSLISIVQEVGPGYV